MSGSVQTDSTLLAEFPDNPPAGGIPPASARNIIASKPPWDVLGGSPAPSIIRGTLDLARWFTMNGGLLGDMTATPAQRVTNATILQNGINYAAGLNRAIAWFPTARVEINSTAGIVFPVSQTGLTVRGQSAPNAGIVQFAPATGPAPILIFGDITGAATLGGQADVEGLYCAYGVTQAGNTGAYAVQFGAWAASRFANLKVDKYGPFGTFPAYVCWYETYGSFSCTFADLNMQGGQQSIMRLTQNGATSGNVYSNVYCSCGNLGAPLPLTDYAFGWGNNGVVNQIFNQLNIESVTTGRLMNIPNCRATVFSDVHLESISLTGAEPLVWACAGSSVTIDGCLLDFRCTTADGASVFGRFVGTFGADTVTMRTIDLTNSTTGNGAVNLPFYLVDGVITPDTPPSISCDGLHIEDDTGTGLSQNVGWEATTMPLSAFAPIAGAGRFQFGENLSRSFATVRTVTATYTHYGADTDATLLVPATLSAPAAITLANTFKASGTGSTTPPLSGNTVRVRRQAGTYANALTVVNGGPGAGTLWTDTDAADERQFTFNGTNWVLSA